MKKKLYLINKLFVPIILIFSLLITIFINTQEVNASMTIQTNSIYQPVVEHLRIKVPKSKKKAWLKAEKESWQDWLNGKSGFIERRIFWDPYSEEATLLISWTNREKWKSIPQDEIDAVQDRFEKIARTNTGLTKGNPFPLVFEGELEPL